MMIRIGLSVGYLLVLVLSLPEQSAARMLAWPWCGLYVAAGSVAFAGRHRRQRAL